MTVRVRFAPSPTGYLHIGGARTALYNYLYAKKMKGTFVLRIEDTDQERSKKEYEQSQMADLKWLGIVHDEGPDCPGEFGPYRQTERLKIYQDMALKLVEEGKAFYCFCSDDEIQEMRDKATKEGRPPHYDGRYRNLSLEEANNRLAAGDKATIRLKAPLRPYVLKDHVRGRVVFPENMVGDFVIMRQNGYPVYNFCCVVDDYLMKITHVIRGEDHLSNNIRQLMVYEALGAEPPEFAHVSLLIGKDRQKLSKRHGATSVALYREQTYLPNALINYLSQLGWSHPAEKDVFDLKEAEEVFTLDRFSKSPAIFDLEKLKFINGQHLRRLDIGELVKKIEEFIPKESLFHKQTNQWKHDCMGLYKDQIEFFAEINDHLDQVFSSDIKSKEELQEVLDWETTPQIKSYLESELSKNEEDFVSAQTFSSWPEFIKKELKIKGKQLFMGMRVVLTGVKHGPELKDLIPLTPVTVLKERMQKI